MNTSLPRKKSSLTSLTLFVCAKRVKSGVLSKKAKVYSERLTCLILIFSLESVQCARCKDHFHMACVSPPLFAKPARGYGWTCAPCSRWHEDQVDAGDGVQTPQTQHSGSNGNRENTPKFINVNPSVNSASTTVVQPVPAKPARGRGRPRKEKPGLKPSSNEEDLKVKHYRMWPFRYFG